MTQGATTAPLNEDARSEVHHTHEIESEVAFITDLSSRPTSKVMSLDDHDSARSVAADIIFTETVKCVLETQIVSELCELGIQP